MIRVKVQEEIETVSKIKAFAERRRLLLASIVLENSAPLMINFWHQNYSTYSFAMSPFIYTLGKFRNSVISGLPIIPVRENYRYLTWINLKDSDSIINFLSYDIYDEIGYCNLFWDNFLNVIPLQYWPPSIEYIKKNSMEKHSVIWRPGQLEQYEAEKCYWFEWNDWKAIAIHLDGKSMRDDAPEELKKLVNEAHRIVVSYKNTNHVWKDKFNSSLVSDLFNEK